MDENQDGGARKVEMNTYGTRLTCDIYVLKKTTRKLRGDYKKTTRKLQENYKKTSIIIFDA